MLFRIEPNKDFFLLNPEASSIPEFSACSSKEMIYITMYVDYKSPLRQQPDVERKRLAALAAGWSPQDTHQKTMQPKVREMMNGEKPHIEEAIKKYREIQYNEDRENLKLYQAHIDAIHKMILSPAADVAELERRSKLLLSFPELRKSQRDLAKIVGMEEEFSKVEEDGINKKMSTIDRYHAEQLKTSEE